MLNQRLFNSQTRPRRLTRAHRRGLSRWQAALLCLFTVLTAGALPAASDNTVDIAGAPVFLLSGTPPNVILTIDDSRSMNQAFLPDDIWGTGDAQSQARIDRQDTAALTNRQYYDPAVTYLPPLRADGSSLGHAEFTGARMDALAAAAACAGCVDGTGNCAIGCNATDGVCTPNLGKQYAPVWNLTPSSGQACKDWAADETSPKKYSELKNFYSADVDHPDFEDFKKKTPPADLGAAWAWRCIKETKDCPAFYHRYRLPAAGAEPNPTCAALDLQRISAAAFPSECLERVIVGEDADLKVVLDKNKNNIYPEVLRDRQAKLKDPDEALTEGDLARRNFANWFSYYRTRLLATQTSVSRVMAGFPERLRLGYQGLTQGQYQEGDDAYTKLAKTFARYEPDPQPDATPEPTSRLPFYQWLYPKRAEQQTFTLSAALRAHAFCSSEQAYLDYPQAAPDSLNNPEHGCRKNFHVIFTDGYWEDLMPKKTPPPRGFDPPSWLENNDGKKNDLPPPSQQSYGRTQGITQYDPTADYARIFQDQNTGMLADVAFYSWITDLRPDLGIDKHAVPIMIRAVSGTPEEVFWNPLNDPADWQHLNTFTVGFGVAGNVHYPEGDYKTNPDGSPCTNPDGTPCTIVKNGFPGEYKAIGLRSSGWLSEEIPVPVKVDDTWHAGINGRGGYLNAGDPSELATHFQEVLNLIGTMAQDSSAAAAAVNTGSTASKDMVYQARLNSAGWSGDVRSFQVSAGLGNPPCATVEVVPGQLCQDPASGDYYQSAADALREATHDTRLIITAAPSETTKDQEGVPFSWDDLSDIGKLDFLTGAGFTGNDPTTATKEQKLEAQARLAYVAGDKTYEVDDKIYRFRTRPLLPVPNKVAACKDPASNPTACTNLLGDFINSAPVMVGPPAFYYNATDYIAYKEKMKDRVALVYAGANDGMLHAFYADTLEEAFAFIPPVLMEQEAARGPNANGGLHQLTLTDYSHQNYVDGPIATGDVKFSDTWHTMLVGTLGLGAQALYALDVTDAPPTAASLESDAKKLFQWEFTDRGDGDPDLGYVFGRPAIVRVRAKLAGAGSEPIWVVITGNGYNSSAEDGSRAAGCDAPDQDQAGKAPCGQAVLYVIAMDDGRVIKKIETGVGRLNDPLNPSNDPSKGRSNALGQATVVTRSIESGDIIADFAYAADLFGNLYRFDLTGNSDEPAVRTLFSAVDAKGIAQPITAPIAVAPHPLGLGTLVLFGTGKYLDLADIDANPEPQVQSFYAIWDIGSNTQKAVSRKALLAQKFLETNLRMTTGEGASIEEVTRGRTSTTNSIDWSKNLGWYIDFDIEKETVGGLNKGERVVTEPEVQGGRVIFVSLVPETNPCAGGGYSWINALDVRNGSRLGITPFDFDLDGSIGEADLLTTSDGGKVVGSSVRLTPGGRNTGIYSSPSSFGDGAGRVTTVVSTSEGDLALINAADIQAWRVWQQLR